jgi:predicted small secreted protein
MNTVNVYRVKTDANWHPYQVIFECTTQTPITHKYPQVYRDDITEGHEDWETKYEDRMDELVGKSIEVYIAATDELGAFVQARALLAKKGDHN